MALKDAFAFETIERITLLLIRRRKATYPLPTPRPGIRGRCLHILPRQATTVPYYVVCTKLDPFQCSQALRGFLITYVNGKRVWQARLANASFSNAKSTSLYLGASTFLRHNTIVASSAKKLLTFLSPFSLHFLFQRSVLCPILRQY